MALPQAALLLLQLNSTPRAAQFNQNGFRFYNDGTETGAVAVDDENVNIATDTTSGDVNFALRIRIKEANGQSGLSTDDFKIQYNHESGGWSDLGTVITGYDSSNLTDGNDTTQRLDDSGLALVTDDFDDNSLDTTNTWSNWGGANVTETSNTLQIDSGTANGDAYGVDTKFVGDFSNASAQIQLTSEGTPRVNGQVIPIQLTESAGNAVYWYVEDSVAYCMKAVASVYTQVGSSRVHTDTDSYRMLILNGNTYWQYKAAGGSWVTQHTETTPIRVKNAYVSVLTYNAAIVTASTAIFDDFKIERWNFIPGKISEDGTIENLAITADNYTELLYSLTVQSSEVSNGDNIEFRVVCNNAELDAYSEIPSITIIDSGGGSTGQIKVFNGTSWVAKPVKVFNGSIWVTKPIKVYDGGSWVDTNY